MDDVEKTILMFSNAITQLNANIIKICDQEDEMDLELLDFMNSNVRVPRRISAIERHGTFWSKDIKEGSAELFKESFRMDRATFNMLVGRMQGIKKTPTNFRRTLPLDERVAIALYALGSSVEYRAVGALFGVSISLVSAILHEFCLEVINKLAPEYLTPNFITQAKIEECVEGFEALGFPQCFGAIDGCHIEVKPHPKDAVDYYNSKGWYSVVLLALIDYRNRFQYVNVGSPGQCHDSEIYNHSRVRTLVESSDLFERNAKMLCGTNVPVLLIGDSAFPLSRSLMQPYPFGSNATKEQRKFNHSLSKSRRVVETAFGHLKARFRRLDKGLDNRFKKSTNIIICCCILHNLLNTENDSINENWQTDMVNKPQPEEINEVDDCDTSAEDIRRAISLHLQKKTQ